MIGTVTFFAIALSVKVSISSSISSVTAATNQLASQSLYIS